jgi:hypothetical protein
MFVTDMENDEEILDDTVLPELVKFKQFPGAIPSTTFLEWQLTPDLVKLLGERRYTRPYLVIIVRSVEHVTFDDDYRYTNYRDTDMHVVPLTALTRYISFSRPGINEVCAMVVDLDRDNSKKLAKAHSNIRNSYDSWFQGDGSAADEFKRAAGWRCIETAPVEVIVSQGSFAPEPPAWNKQLVHQFFRGKDFDQCHFGKRSFISGMLLVPILPLSYLGKLLLTLLGAFFGLSKLNVKQFLLPFEFSPFNIFDTAERSVWVEKKEKDKDGLHLDRHPFFWLVNPVAQLGPALIVFGIFQIPKHHGKSKGLSPWCGWGWWHTLLVVDASIVAIFLLVAICVFLAPVVGALLGSNLLKRPLQWLSKLTGGIEETRTERLHQELQGLAMSTEHAALLAPSVRPKPRRSVAVLFAQLKAEVCKPYAR